MDVEKLSVGGYQLSVGGYQLTVERHLEEELSVGSYQLAVTSEFDNQTTSKINK